MSRLIPLAIALTLSIGAASGITSVVVTQDAQGHSLETAAAEQRLFEATRALGGEREAWEAQRAEADETVDAAQEVLDASEGRVLDEAPRIALAEATENAKTLLAQADARIGMLDRGYRDVYFAAGDDRDAASVYEVARYAEDIELPDVVVDLSAEVEGVESAVLAWEAEQARIAAEAERARETERPQTSTPTPSAPPGPSESPEARVQRLMSALGISIPFVIQNTSCGGRSNVLGCYDPANDGVIILTPYLLTKDDAAVCRTISHEFRHYIQVRDLLGYDRSANVWDTGWMEADARAHERGC